MAFGQHEVQITLNGSGAGSGILLLYGILSAIRVERSSGTPTVTISDGVDTILSGVAVASDTTYHPMAEAQNNAGTGQGQYQPYQLNGPVTITVTGGAAAGTVTVKAKMF